MACFSIFLLFQYWPVYLNQLDKKIVVSSLTIQSPMSIGLDGIGEIIREVRETVKDFYRNPRERQMLDQQLSHDAEMKKIKLAKSKLKLIRSANRTFDGLGLSKEDKNASIKALFDPANEASKLIQRKDLTID